VLPQDGERAWRAKMERAIENLQREVKDLRGQERPARGGGGG